MRVPNGTTVLVADGGRMLLLENRGEAFSPRLEVVGQMGQNVPPDREIGTDRPGRSASSVGTARSAMEETDFHRQAEERFAVEIAAQLKESCDAGSGDVIVIAPPRTLGELRRHYKNGMAERVIAEIAKDLTGHPVPAIARLIADYPG